MNPTIEVSEADRVPEDARVCHYDELTGEAKHALPDAVENGATTVRWRAAEQFSGIDVVKFTSYYRVTVTEMRDSWEETQSPTRSSTLEEPRSVITDRRPSEPDEPLL